MKNKQLNKEESNTLTNEDILEVFEKLIKYLKLSKKNLNKNTNDILQISLEEYDIVSKESAYILGECSTMYDLLYVEIIDFQIGCIGGIMCNKIKNGGTFKW